MNNQPANTQSANSYVDDYAPPTSGDNTQDSNSDLSNNSSSDLDLNSENNTEVSNDSSGDESIEDQNIFEMLGVDDGTDELKENFLDELQNVVWDDFLDNDVSLLITSDETPEYQRLLDKKNSAVEDVEKEAVQDKLVKYLEGLIPDLEDIMLEKALDLKADLFAERIAGMKEYFVDKPEQLKKIGESEKLMFDDKWESSTKILNEIQE